MEEDHGSVDEVGRCVFIAPAKDMDAELTVRRSRFIASLRTALDADSAALQLKTFPLLYPKANHHCWAYRVGLTSPQEHCSDDGEPGGTAGRPILGAIKRHLLDNTLLVVTRYFGGVKLGVRGLIEAYGEAAELAIAVAGTVEMELNKELVLTCGYDYAKTLSATLKKWGFSEKRQSAVYGEKVETTLEVPLSISGAIAPQLEEMQARGFLSRLAWGDEVLVRPRWAEQSGMPGAQS